MSRPQDNFVVQGFRAGGIGCIGCATFVVLGIVALILIAAIANR